MYRCKVETGIVNNILCDSLSESHACITALLHDIELIIDDSHFQFDIRIRGNKICQQLSFQQLMQPAAADNAVLQAA